MVHQDPVHQDPVGPSWEPRPARRGLYALGAVVAFVLAVVTDTGPLGLGAGLAFTVIAVVLTILAGLDAWYGCPLSAGPEGVTLRNGPGRVTFIPWSEIERIEATTTTSRGLLRLASLELDRGEQLVVLSRHRLGADPVDVAVELRRWRRSGPRPR